MPGRFWPAWPESNGPEGAPRRDGTRGFHQWKWIMHRVGRMGENLGKAQENHGINHL